MIIFAQLTVAEVYRNHPETLPVLQKYKIDLCCGGRHTLEFVAGKHGIDLDQLLRELNESLKVRS